MILLFLLSVALLAYVYAGYPLLLRGVVRLRGARAIRRADITPSISLVISAFNEAAVIQRKLENALALIYPKDALEIVVISDASNDGTDEIVKRYAGRGVRLERQPERRGKTAGLNRTMTGLKGEIVVFSDANAMYQPDALLKLARNFADPDVGCVTGEARYIAGDQGVADLGERVYWNYEIQIKRLETALGSMVGGDGAIYAIRRGLWQPLPENAINDFLNPLQIVEAGWRAVYEPEAVCYEETSGGIRTEYRRRVRIVSRSWRAVFQARGVFNPLRVGLFTWSLVSHKMLRWLSGAFAAVAMATGLSIAAARLDSSHAIPLLAVLSAAALFASTRRGRRAIAMSLYVGTIYAASVVGIVRGSVGRVSGIWAPPRQPDGTVVRHGTLIHIGLLLQVAIALALVGMWMLRPYLSVEQFAVWTFWASVAVLGYVYAGYPLLLAVIRRVAGRPVRQAPIEPRVCVFIAANDEADIIETKILNTLALDYPADRIEIVVASDGSVDGTNDIVRRFAARVRLLEFFPRRGKIATINKGIATVASDVVVFSDANTFLEPDAVRALVRNFADPDVGAVSGDVVLVGERAALARSEDLYYRYERWVQRAESEVGSMIGADGALYAVRRELFTAPPSDTILDDMAIPMAVIKAGRRVVFDDAARAVEQGSESAMQEFSRKARVVAGAMQFVRRRDSAVPATAGQVIFSLISHKALRWLSPLFSVGALVSSLVLRDVNTLYSVALSAQVTVLALGAAGCIPALRRVSFIAVAHYFCLLQAAATVGFVRGLAGRQSVMWRRFQRSPVRIARV